MATAFGKEIPFDKKINLDFREVMRKGTNAVFLPYDYENFNLLIADPGGNNTIDKNSPWHKEMLRKHFEEIGATDSLPIPIQIHFLDSFPEINDVNDAVILQIKHNADLILYNLGSSLESTCDDDRTYLYHISNEITDRFCPQSLPTPNTSTDFNYSTNTMEFEKGRLTIKPQYFNAWIKAIMSLKTDSNENLFYDFYKWSSYSTVNNLEVAEMFFTLGQTYYNLCWKDYSLYPLSQALKWNPQHIASLLIRASVYSDSSRYEDALKDLSRTIELDSVNAAAYYERGKVLYKIGQIKQAIDDLNKAIKLEPLNFWAYKLRKIIRTTHPSLKSEMEDYDQKIDFDSCFHSYSIELGVIYSLIQQYSNSIRVFDLHLERNPRDYDALTSRGEIYRMAGEYERALEDTKLAISLNRRNSAAYATLAMIYADQGDTSSFYRYVKKAHKIYNPYPFKERMYEKETLYQFVNDQRFLEIINN